MTKAERLAAKIAARQRDPGETAPGPRAGRSGSRDETRKATNKRRYQVGALADEAGLLGVEQCRAAPRCLLRLVTLRAQIGGPAAS